MAHHHLRFHLLHGIQRNTNQDDDGSTAQRQVVHTGSSSEQNRKKCNHSEEQRANQCDLRKNL